MRFLLVLGIVGLSIYSQAQYSFAPLSQVTLITLQYDDLYVAPKYETVTQVGSAKEIQSIEAFVNSYQHGWRKSPLPGETNIPGQIILTFYNGKSEVRTWEIAPDFFVSIGNGPYLWQPAEQASILYFWPGQV